MPLDYELQSDISVWLPGRTGWRRFAWPVTRMYVLNPEVLPGYSTFDEFYPFHGAVKAIREAADLVGMDKLMWGFGLSPHDYGYYL